MDRHRAASAKARGTLNVERADATDPDRLGLAGGD
jgi:hypothetical protein